MRLAILGLLLAWPALTLADPWVGPGDMALRHDLAVLADQGILRAPITTWPLSWPDIARDVLGSRADASLDAATVSSLRRVQRAARREVRMRDLQWQVRSALAEEPSTLRTFAAEPREQVETGAAIGWTGERFALRVQATAVADPDDDKDLRFDGSYVGANIGNFMVSAGMMDRWWGPGWEGSLILSTSARPIPAIAIERNYSDAFRWPILRWLGPWRATFLLGQLEGDRTDFPDARFAAARVSFKPVPQLEIGLSRTAQWCGEGRPCDLDTFVDLLAGEDNDQPGGEQPGNQLAGYDARLGFASFPLALYGQMIGEDEAGGLPAKFMGLAGLETYGHTRWGDWRAHVEYADTTCNFAHETPEFSCAYESSIYTQGYRFRGRSIGHAMDADSRMYSLGLMLVGDRDELWQLLVRRVELNRDAVLPDPRHSLTPLAAELLNVELLHQRAVRVGQLRIGIGYDDYQERLDNDEMGVLRGFIQFYRTF